MTDIEQNISNLLTNQRRIAKEITAINPILAQQIDQNISDLTEFTREVMHRGRFGAPRYMKEPDAARRRLLRIEALLLDAAVLAQEREDQADIPVLDI